MAHQLLAPVRRRGGFTLVELLVVIGIIAVLIAILLPALQAAKRQAMTVKCNAHLKQIGAAFFLYAIDNKGYFPVAKYDLSTPMVVNGKSISNLYWTDYIAPYIARIQNNRALEGDSNAFSDVRRTVLWGCPAWDGIAAVGSLSGFNVDGVSVYETGYSFNICPTYRVNNPANPTAGVPTTEWAIVSPSQPMIGKWYKQNVWSSPSERCLAVDANLWLLFFYPADSTHFILPQQIDRGIPGSPGGNNFDRYRHGKYPPPDLTGTRYDRAKGKVSFNMVFADGHCENLNDINKGYKAIRMRDP